jgi:hypothetical protein
MALATDLLAVHQGSNLCIAVCQSKCRSGVDILLELRFSTQNTRKQRATDGIKWCSCANLHQQMLPRNSLVCNHKLSNYSYNQSRHQKRDGTGEYTFRLSSPKDKLLARRKPQLLSFQECQPICSLSSGESLTLQGLSFSLENPHSCNFYLMSKTWKSSGWD